MKLKLENYLLQKNVWPQSGRHILAQFDADSIIVYQAYGETIANFASRNGYFGDGFRLDRMSWIKVNFLWMMYRSGWAQKERQTHVLAIRIKRPFFDKLLSLAVQSSYNPEMYTSPDEWKSELENSGVLLQWDPDHKPNGEKEERKAIQLGLRGKLLKEYSKEMILNIYDITDFVMEQYTLLKNESANKLITPLETAYAVRDEQTKKRIGLL